MEEIIVLPSRYTERHNINNFYLGSQDVINIGEIIHHSETNRTKILEPKTIVSNTLY